MLFGYSKNLVANDIRDALFNLTQDVDVEG